MMALLGDPTLDGAKGWLERCADSPTRCVLMTEEVAVNHSGGASEITSLILGIARALVDSPDNVFVEAIHDQGATTLRLRVDQSDIGKIIGKQGRTARSLRTILSAASMKVQHRYSLDIIDNTKTPQ